MQPSHSMYGARLVNSKARKRVAVVMS
jgi:hypothetical protein